MRRKRGRRPDAPAASAAFTDVGSSGWPASSSAARWISRVGSGLSALSMTCVTAASTGRREGGTGRGVRGAIAALRRSLPRIAPNRASSSCSRGFERAPFSSIAQFCGVISGNQSAKYEPRHELLAALPADDRVIWALALYAGLRRGELMALRWLDVDLAAGVIRVERSWDPKMKVFVEPKSRSGRRKVPIAGVLRDLLVEHKLGAKGELVLGRDGTRAFGDSALAARALRAWQGAGLEPITLHEARHTFASLMIAAGVNARALATYMGHASVTITYDRYGHLMPGNEDEAAALLDAYLERANTRARLAAIEGPA